MAGSKSRFFTGLSIAAFAVLGVLLFIVPRMAPPEQLPPAGGIEKEGPAQPLGIVTADGKTHNFNVEIAETEYQQERGLMFRKQMADDHGMLFVFQEPGERNFWMKNTEIPLDILYIEANGVIHHIAHDAKPQDLTPLPSQGVVLNVLELNGGLTARLGIKEGDVVHHGAFGNVLAQ
jgi:uncharacterized membrane protein (UPF0127 family)